MSGFDVILADPPWKFEHWSKTYISGRDARNHYDVMTTDDICKLSLSNFLNENCALFLWACWPHLKHAIDVIDAWGFEYKSLAWIWVKLNENSMGTHVGLGYYTRANSEPCLLAVRGTMPVAAHDVQALIMSPIREHSRKPDEQYAKIERLYPNARYLEMFARRKHSKKWSVWGNEVESDIQIAVR